MKIDQITFKSFKSFAIASGGSDTYRPDTAVNNTQQNIYQYPNDIAKAGGGLNCRFNKVIFNLKNMTGATAGSVSVTPRFRYNSQDSSVPIYIPKTILSGSNSATLTITAIVIAGQQSITFPAVDIDGADLVGFDIITTGTVLNADLYVTLFYDPSN